MMPFDFPPKKYRFHEALTIYDLYYERAPDVARHRSERRRALAEDRPITRFPLVLHGTTFEGLSGSIQEGPLWPTAGKTFALKA